MGEQSDTAVPEDSSSYVEPTTPATTTEPGPSDIKPDETQNSPYLLYVEKGSHTMTVFERDVTGEYSELVMTCRVALGTEFESTPEGTFVVESAKRWHCLPSGKYVQYALFFTDDLFISSALYDTDDINTLCRESYIGIGKKVTNGSIYTTADTASWIFDNCPAGTNIHIVEGSPLGTISDKPADLNPDYFFTDPTDPLRPDMNPPLPSDYMVYIEKGTFTITVYSKDENGEYTKSVRSYLAALGKTAGRTPSGTFGVQKKERWHTFPAPFIGGYAQFASYFYNTLMIHSPVYGLKDNKYMVPESYEEIGTMCTAGCLRTTTEAAYWIYTYCPEGTVVEIVNGSPVGNHAPSPPEPDPRNPWKDPTDPFLHVSECSRTGTVENHSTEECATLRNGPGNEYGITGMLLNGTTVTLIDDFGDWYKINFINEDAYIEKNLLITSNTSLEPFTERLYAHTLPKAGSVLESEKDKMLVNDLIDVRSIINGIDINLVFATEDNFTGKKLYPLEVCLLQRGTAEKLKRANDLFKEDGYTIRIFDAYRPYSVQQVLFDVIQDPFYIADPKKASLHNRGAAVDMTLLGPDGNEIEMPSPMHTFGPEAHVNNPDMTDEARKNLDYMQNIMKQCGFYVYDYEWWHFTDLDCLDYMATDYDFTEIIYSDELPPPYAHP